MFYDIVKSSAIRYYEIQHNPLKRKISPVKEKQKFTHHAYNEAWEITKYNTDGIAFITKINHILS